jgi:hypothetical protein
VEAEHAHQACVLYTNKQTNIQSKKENPRTETGEQQQLLNLVDLANNTF